MFLYNQKPKNPSMSKRILYTMRVSDILAKKRDGHQLSDEEILFFVESVTNQKASMEQIGAFLMAVGGILSIIQKSSRFRNVY